MSLPKPRIPPATSTSLPDDPSSQFAFPGTPAEHPASIELDTGSATSLRETLEAPDAKEGKHHRSLSRHRPHLHLSRHGRPAAGSQTDSPTATNSRHAGIDTSLLKVPKTYSPHARSLDTTNGTGEKVKPDIKEPPAKEQIPESGRQDEPRQATVNEHDSPSPPVALNGSEKKAPREQSVWEQVRYERDEKPGITPAYLTPLLTTLLPLTRSHTLKLSTATRTIEHRIAEWAILGDKLDALDREAAEIGVALLGTAEWRRITASHSQRTTTKQSSPASSSNDDDDDDEETPTKILANLLTATSRSATSLSALSRAVDARAEDVHRLKGKIGADSAVLERRMATGLERKMLAIERAEREAKRRDLVINVVTFTVLLLLGIAVSRLVLKLSTAKWCVVVRDWMARWVFRVVQTGMTQEMP